jgi:hypothetical protein
LAEHVILHNIRCEGTEYKDAYEKLEKWRVGDKAVRESNGSGQMDESKVHPQWVLRCTLRHHLNMNLNINNENQDSKVGRVCGRLVLVGVGRLKEGD